MLRTNRVRVGILVSVVGMMVVFGGTDAVIAQPALAYSFELGDLDGFEANPLGLAIIVSEEDTIGVTEGSRSMKLEVNQNATFVGAVTGQLDGIETSIGDPPGVDYIAYDLTLEEQFPSEGFVDTSIMMFGLSQDGQTVDPPVQFFDNQVAVGDLEPGTHSICIELTRAVHPLTFEINTFNEILGTEGSGENDVIPTGFQIYFNKSTQAPWTGYIDNVRAGHNIPGDYTCDGMVGASDLSLVLENWGSDEIPRGWGTQRPRGETVGAQQLSPVLENWGLTGVPAVPEPSSLALVLISLGVLVGCCRQRSAAHR